MNKQTIKQFIKQHLPRPIVEFIEFLKYRNQKLINHKYYLDILENKRWLEIGGPSIAFKIILPIYPVISNLDSVNFSNKTMWEGLIDEGKSFNYYKNKTGMQFIAEATDLSHIKNNEYDFLLSSNCLEHIANPLKALDEWVRVIKPNGYLLLVLPKKDSNFDHKRQVTLFEHILEDFNNNITEHDQTHLSEILELHDLSRDAAAGSIEQFKLRSLNNFTNRGLHHHVFDMSLIKSVFNYYNIDLLQESETNNDYFAIGKVIKHD